MEPLQGPATTLGSEILLMWKPHNKTGIQRGVSLPQLILNEQSRRGTSCIFIAESSQLVLHGGIQKTGIRANTVQNTTFVFQVNEPQLGWRPLMKEVGSRDGEPTHAFVVGPTRYDHAVAYFAEHGTMVVHGGKDGKHHVRGDAYFLNINQRRWQNLADMVGGCAPPQLYGHAMIQFEDSLLVLGPQKRKKLTRASRGEETPSADARSKESMHMYILSLLSDEKCWSEVAMGNDIEFSSRRNFVLSRDDSNKRIFLAGGYFATTPLHDVWSFDCSVHLWQKVSGTVGDSLLFAGNFRTQTLLTSASLAASLCAVSTRAVTVVGSFAGKDVSVQIPIATPWRRNLVHVFLIDHHHQERERESHEENASATFSRFVGVDAAGCVGLLDIPYALCDDRLQHLQSKTSSARFGTPMEPKNDEGAPANLPRSSVQPHSSNDVSSLLFDF